MRRDGLMIKILIQTAQYFPEQFIVVDDLPDGMDHIAAFIIFIRSLRVRDSRHNIE